MPKVSVIVPVYNVEHYIECCARSLFEQTLDDIEYIFVNDCTPDRSMEILSRILVDYPYRKEQVRIIEMPLNSGQAEVRKVGINAATGDYIINCDSDDWVEKTYFSELYGRALETKAAIVVNNKLFREEPNRQSVLSNAAEHYPKRVYFQKLLTEEVYHFLVNTLIRRSLFLDNPIIYPTANSAEDFALLVQLFYYADEISFINIPLYHYRYNPCSITGDMSLGKTLERCDQVHKNVELIISFLRMKGLEELYKDDLLMLKYSVRMQIKSYIGDKGIYDKWRSIYPELDSMFLCNNKVPFKKKISYLLSYFRLEPYYRKLYSALKP